MKEIISLLRPKQWLKNLFIFLPLFFSRNIYQVSSLVSCVIMFTAFCLAASGIYCLNDICDVEADKQHPTKSHRPIASGAISKRRGLLIMFICYILSFFIIFFAFGDDEKRVLSLMSVLLTYILMNIAYCVKLKHLAIIDIFIIAIGFVIRIIAGGFASGVHLSHWIVMMTFLLALFLAFAKRRDDVVIYQDSGRVMRKSINRYSLTFMNQIISVIASITMVCYIMYTVSEEVITRFQNQYVFITSIFVLAGIIRYLQITTVDVKSGDPTMILLKDRFIQLCIVGWLASFVIILYL